MQNVRAPRHGLDEVGRTASLNAALQTRGDAAFIAREQHMVSQSPLARSLCLELTPQEGRGLLDFIASLPVDFRGVRAADNRMSAIEDALGEAEAVALWLHENVRLSIPPEEAADLLGTLAGALEQVDPAPRVRLDSLLPVKRKLVEAASY
jgi:hypothetical protein